MLYKRIIRPILFSMDAEKAHHFTIKCLDVLGSSAIGRWLLKTLFTNDFSNQPIEICGLKFRNRVGLAAGLDKDAVAFRGLSALGFGFVEVGTVTPEPQPGNDRPRLFRLKKDEALINRMGFNNHGVKAMRAKLVNHTEGMIIGGNIGKNKSTPNENAVNDYLKCMKALHDVVDYFVVNISSPNTPGLRELQDEDHLTDLLAQLVHDNNTYSQPKPIFVKIAPDLSDEQLGTTVEVINKSGVHGVIATNTTIGRNDLLTSDDELKAIGNGGLSGKPLSKRSTEVITKIRSKARKGLIIIASGGVNSSKDALNKLESGADLIQIYTGFVYEGPDLINEINKELKLLN